MQTKIADGKVWLLVGSVTKRKAKRKKAGNGGKLSASALHRQRLQNLEKGRRKKARIKKQRLRNLAKARAARARKG